MARRKYNEPKILPNPVKKELPTTIKGNSMNVGKKRGKPPRAGNANTSMTNLSAISRRLHDTVLPKRRKVLRACDRCRKLKIRCSGDIPCIHCTVYSYECTYNHPTRTRRKNNGSGSRSGSELGSATSSRTISALASSNPELLAKLSDRLKLYDDILHRLLPDVKLTDLNDNPRPINPMKLMAALNKLRNEHQRDSLAGSQLITQAYESLPEIPVPYIPTVKLPGGHSGKSPSSDSSPAEDKAGENTAIQADIGSVSLTPTRSSSRGNSEDNLSLGKEIKIILPSREVALTLISKTWGSACVLFRFYHRPAFIEDLNELYDLDPSQYTNKQQRFLPLVYSVLACGSLFFKSEERTSGVPTKTAAGLSAKDVDDEGYHYFIAARKLIDITDTRDTFGIQTIVMLIIFLQCSARLSTCYAYIGIALRAALREGLHRKLDYPFNPIELEIRKRLFWTLYKMDIYVNTMLGLPRTISEDDFDQELPIELDDENITVTGYRWDKQGSRLSSSGIANAHTKLMLIMGHIVAKLYPVKRKRMSGLDAQGKRHSGMLAHTLCSQLEEELQQWLDGLPMELKPGVEPPRQYLKANRMLHVSYLHVKIILYRPFIHYIAAQLSSNSSSSASIAKAHNCINVARVVVKLAEDMIKRQILSGSYWFSIYTIFFSVACLVYYVHYAPSRLPDGGLDPNYAAVKKDAEVGKKVLDQLKDSSSAARRTYNILNALFDQMNRQSAGSNRGPGFVTPQMGRWAQSNILQPPATVALGEQTGSSPDPEQSAKHHKHRSKRKARYSNEQISNIVNGVNFIDGIPTGITLESFESQPKLQENSSQQNVQAQVAPVGVKNAKAFPMAQFEQATPFAPSSDASIEHRVESTSPSADSQYVPGPMDQLDMKIFGRFLPPYMLSPHGHQENVLFGEMGDQNVVAKKNVVIPSIEEALGASNSSGRATGIKSPLVGVVNDDISAMPLASDQPDLPDSLLPFGNQQSKLFQQANSAIPSGLSTVVQSEQEREQDGHRKHSGDGDMNGDLENLLFESWKPDDEGTIS